MQDTIRGIDKNKFLFWFCIAALLLVAIPLLYSKLSEVRNPQVGWNPPQLTWATRVYDNQALYPSEGNTFSEGMIAYSPLYFLLWGNFGKVGGMSLQLGMGLSMVFTLVVCYLLYLITIKLTRNANLGLIPPLLFIAGDAVRHWSNMPGPDMMALALTLGGMYLIISEKELFSTPLFALAIFTKQSYIVAPITVGIYLLYMSMKRKKDWFLPYITLMVGLVLIPFSIVNYLTYGEFYRHVITFASQSGVMEWGTVPSSVLLMIILNLVPILLGTIGLVHSCVIVRRIPREIRPKIGLLVIWFLISLVVMACLIGKKGSGYNYGLEWIAVSSILGGVFIDRILNTKLVTSK